MDSTDKVLDVKIPYKNPVFHVEERLIRKASGKEYTHYTVVKVPYVGVIALTNDKKIIMLKQKRWDGDSENLEFPGGQVNELNPDLETIKKYGLKELEEEAGYKATQIEFLNKDFEKSTLLERKFYNFIAWDLEEVGVEDNDENSRIEVLEISVEEAGRLAITKEITAPEDCEAMLLALEKFKEKGLL